MHDYVKAMVTISRRLKSMNSIPVERATITAEEFKAISNELERLEILCGKQFKELMTLSIK